MTFEHMADAAFAQNIPPGFAIAAGYYGGPLAYNVWAPGDWRLFPGNRLLIWVAGYNGAAEGQQAGEALAALGVPEGCITAVDMEKRRDKTMLAKFDKTIEEAEETHAEILAGFADAYKTWVYGSASTVMGNEPLNGYWVADYGLTAGQLMAVLETPHVRAIQYASFPAFDASLVKQWAEGEMWHG